MANTFTRNAGDLIRNTPVGYRKIDGNIYNAPVQGGGYYSGPESGAPTIDQSAIQPAAGGVDSPMLPSGGASVAGDPMDSFNKLSLGLLNSAKGLTTADLLQKRRALERASIDRSTTITPEDERVLSPGQQSAIRSGRTEALTPEIDANAYELEKAEQSIDNFFKIFELAQKTSKDFADKMVAPDSVIENAKKVIEADSSKLATVLSGFNDKSKQAILGSLDYSQMKDLKSGESFTLSPGENRYDSTGRLIASGGPKPLSQAQETANIAREEKEVAAQQQATQSIGNVNNLLAGDAYKNITGAGQNPLNVFGVSNARALNEYNQLQGMLKLGIRGLLKGQGAVSDYEGRVLSQASSALGRNLSNEEFKQALLKIRGVLQTNAGGETQVIVKDKNGKILGSGMLNGQDIYEAVNDGNTIEYQ